MGTSWPVIGHEWAVAHLARALEHGRVRHAYLFTGPRGVGKTTLARAFAAALNCTGKPRPCGKCRACTLTLKGAHPDLTTVEPEREGGAVKIDQVRGLQQMLALRPYEARYRVAILRRFDQARPVAQDALLKTLEEPAPNAVLVLTADAPDRLLPTIISRCQVLNLRLLPLPQVQKALEQDFGAPPEQAQLLAHLSGGRMGWAIRALQNPTVLESRESALAALQEALSAPLRARFALADRLARDKSALRDVLDTWQGFWRDVLLAAAENPAPLSNVDWRQEVVALAQQVGVEGAETALRATRRTLDYLGRNVNARLALEVLLLDYPAV